MKAHRIKVLAGSTPTLTHAPMDFALNKANELQSNHVGKLLIQIFTDAKRLTLSAWNWPARYVTAEASNVFSVKNENRSVIPNGLSLQYVTPKTHLELMSCIMESDIEDLKTKIDQCLAISLRIDGSVDRSQLDKIYVLGKIITLAGEPELIFFGVSGQVERKANGLLKTALKAMENQFGLDFVENVILRKVSSICTDGTNVNSGDEGGIWKLFEDKLLDIGTAIPLLKIWCAAHRADLAFNALADAVPQSDEIFKTCSHIASHFRKSSVRTNELKEKAATIGLKIKSMPKLFEVRWTQFTFQLLRSIANNWHALALYFTP